MVRTLAAQGPVRPGCVGVGWVCGAMGLVEVVAVCRGAGDGWCLYCIVLYGTVLRCTVCQCMVWGIKVCL